MPALAHPSVVDPHLLAATQRLTLTARRLVAGAVAGVHASRRSGLSREFSQYRPYQAGDEPRHIDWKLFSRTDRYYLREGEIDTRASLSLILDATASMQQRDTAAEAETKFDRARALAAAFALLAETQGDAISLHLVSDEAVTSVRTAQERQPFAKIVRSLAAAEPTGRWPRDPQQLTQDLRRSGLDARPAPPGTTTHLTVVITDGHAHGDEIRASLLPLRARQHEVVLIHLLSSDEVTFPFHGPVRFEEWETGRVVETDAGAVRAAYLAAQAKEQTAWKREWTGHHFDYLPLVADESLERGLRAYLLRRNRR